MPGYGPGMMENMGGFDPSDLMAKPEIGRKRLEIRQTWSVLHMSKQIKWQLKTEMKRQAENGKKTAAVS